MAQVHSVLLRAGQEPCAVTGRPAAPPLRPYVAGYSAFRAGAGVAAGRRMLALSLVTVIVDVAGPAALVSGQRDTALELEDAGWRSGVAIGLTPAGARAVLGPPMRELAGAVVPLDGLLGSRAGQLIGRLGPAPGSAARFDVLDDLLTAWLRPDRQPDPAAAHGWQRLQDAAGGITISALAAELGAGRRRLETGFGREIGLTPKTVARIARFQAAVQVIAAPSATLGAAVACGYADQPHLSREVRAMAGITPAQLRAIVQYTGRLPG
jgi:AraC-like DNA-binding protein